MMHGMIELRALETTATTIACEVIQGGLLLSNKGLNLPRAPLTIAGITAHPDPLPQALVLTAIVIGFGMTAFTIALAVRARGELGSDHVDAGREDEARADDLDDSPGGGHDRSAIGEVPESSPRQWGRAATGLSESPPQSSPAIAKAGFRLLAGVNSKPG